MKNPHAKNTLLWMPLLLSSCLAALYLSWSLFAKVDFLYTLWYDALKIDRLIEHIGPHHHHKPLFHHTDKEEHLRLFHEINTAVHNNGIGLSRITYADPKGVDIETLLTPAEITHLKDVARLIDGFLKVGKVSCLITVLYAATLIHQRIPRPPLTALLKGSLVAATIIGIAVALYGPVELFYQLHIWLFPAEHQWFFYYEESLMTLMMFAPYLFGYISALLIISAALFTALFIWIDHHLHHLFSSEDRA